MMTFREKGVELMTLKTQLKGALVHVYVVISILNVQVYKDFKEVKINCLESLSRRKQL